LGADESPNDVGIALTAGSTALSSHSVSALNPRLLAMRFNSPDGQLTIAAFTRGEKMVELVTSDRTSAELRFYVVGFALPCDDGARGCSPGDLLTEAVEHDWTETTLYGEEDLADTVLDCRQCHQPDGPGTPKLLRMQEFSEPWTHWLFRGSEGGQALLADYMAAKGDEVYAGFPAERIESSHPGNLLPFLLLGQATEPNPFDGYAIEAEVKASAGARGGAQPQDNSVPGTSATWQAVYDRAVRGEAIGAPYHDVKVTDPHKLAALSAAYRDYRAGVLAREDLPDLRDVYPDDPALLAELGFTTKPGLDGEGVLRQACTQCHNDRLDQRLSRAGFNVNLAKLSRGQKDLAIARLGLPDDDPLAMPPRRLRSLSDEARTRLIDLLSE